MPKTKHHIADEIPFRFIGSLCDFLPKRAQGHFRYPLLHPTTTKDAIEAIGVPHVEVECIKVNQQEVPFTYLLQPSDTVIVYPFKQPIIDTNTLLRPALKHPLKFILDVHLGTLARILRLSGFDTRYETEATDRDIARLAAQEERIVLTRDIGLLKHKIIHWGYWLRSQHRDEQFKEVACRFNLWSSFTPFSFCLACNGKIEAVAKENIIESIPSNAALYFHDFFQCKNCQKIYWKGSHYDHMIHTLRRLHSQSPNC